MIGVTGVGTWGVGLQIADMSFIEDLSHTVRVAYYRGTNDNDVIKKWGGGSDDNLPYTGAESIYMTDKDYAWEVNFDHQYQIYENLAAIVELSYIHLDLSDEAWGANDLDDTDDAWKAQLLFQYSF